MILIFICNNDEKWFKDVLNVNKLDIWIITVKNHLKCISKSLVHNSKNKLKKMLTNEGHIYAMHIFIAM